MRLQFIAFFLLASVVFIVSACQTPARRGAGFSVSSSGEVIARPTGFTFPRRIGSFTRANTHQYDAAGQDLSVKYVAGTLIVVDVYDYPASGRTETAEFVARKTEIKEHHSDARLLAEGNTTIHPSGQPHRGRKAVFAFSENFPSLKPPYKSQLLLFQNGKRFIKYRCTYSAAHSARAEVEIESFLNELAWPPSTAN